jgi:elongation factor 1-alpha
MSWYKGWNVTIRDKGEVKGMTLLDALQEAVQPPNRAIEMPLRIPILNVYKIGGIGTVAIGRVACGVLKKGETVVVMPNNLQGVTNSIEIYHSDRKEAMAGKIIY